MKNLWKYIYGLGLFVGLLVLLGACSQKLEVKPDEDQTGTEAGQDRQEVAEDGKRTLKDKRDNQEAKKNPNQAEADLNRPIPSEEEGRRKLMTDFNTYLNDSFSFENYNFRIQATNQLVAISPYDPGISPDLVDPGVLFAQMREYYPGKYRVYLNFYDDQDREDYLNTGVINDAVAMDYLYINEDTGKSFISYGSYAILALSDSELVAYVPDIGEDFLVSYLVMWSAWKNGLIDNMEGYDLEPNIREFTPDWEGPVNPDPNINYAQVSEFVNIYPIISWDTFEQVQVLNFNSKYLSVSDYYTDQVIYQNPLTQYQVQQITETSATDELVKILEKLKAFDLSQGRYVFQVEDQINLESPRNGQVESYYQIAIRSDGEGVMPVVARYALSTDGVRVAQYNVVDDTYYFIYGNLMP